MEKILVTGGAGSIGSSLVKALLKRKGSSVYVFDSLLTGKKENLPFKNSNLIFKECNINNITELESAWEDNIFDFVFQKPKFVHEPGVLKYTANVEEYEKWVPPRRHMLSYPKFLQ